MSELLKLLELNPTVAAVREGKSFDNAVNSPVSVIFTLNANILNLPELVEKAKSNGKTLFVHIDVAEGVGKDTKGLSYLQRCGVDGIISTRTSLIKAAKEMGLATVQRFFMVDTHSLSTALDNIRQVKPNMVEIMPGIIPSVIAEMKSKISIPVIAGGLIGTREDAIKALKAGAAGISTGKEQLWYE